jgi:hypothetical protein
VSTSQYILYAALFFFILATQLGHRKPNGQRLLLPIVIVAAIGFKNLKTIPGGNIAHLLVLGGLALGILFGLASIALIRVGKDPITSRLVTVAGVPYAALWISALAARFGFAYGSVHWFHADLVSFSIQHHVTPSTYGTALTLWVLVMIAVRTIGVIIRGLAIGAKIDFREIGLRHRRSPALEQSRS